MTTRKRSNTGPVATRPSRHVASPSNDPVEAEVDRFHNQIANRIEMVAIDQLKLNPRASQTHGPEQIAMLKASICTYGFPTPLQVNADTVILNGHGRYLAAKELGMRHLPVIRIEHLSEDEQRGYMLADNWIAKKAGIDIEILKVEIKHSLDFGFTPQQFGFTTPQIDLTLHTEQSDTKQSASEDASVDAVVEPAEGPAVSRLGDIFVARIGSRTHRVLCGDATRPESYAVLMQGVFARMVFTDFPYNVKIKGFVSGLGKVKHREFVNGSGELSEEGFIDFLTESSRHATSHLIVGGLFFGFMDWRSIEALIRAMKALSLKPINLCVWNKGTGGMGSLYRSQHELCLVCKKGDAPHVNNVELGRHGRYRTNVWDHPGMASFGQGRDEAIVMHPTVKPVNLLTEAIMDVTHLGDTVLDPFLGSGSTLMAAEKVKRVCYGIELDPIYVDTIVRRIEATFDVPVVHEQTGLTFAELTTQRREEVKLAIGPAADNDAGNAAAAPLAHVRKRNREAR